MHTANEPIATDEGGTTAGDVILIIGLIVAALFVGGVVIVLALVIWVELSLSV